MINKTLLILLTISSLFLFSCGTTNLSTQDDNPPIAPLEEENNEIAAETISTPQEAATDEPIPTASITNSPEASQINSQLDTESLCYHPYFPIVDGAFWTFDVFDDEDYTLRIEETGEDTFRMIQEMEDEDITYSVDWYCSDQGILRGSFGQVDLINQAAGGEEAPEFQFETLEWEGETLPAPELLEVGYPWTSSYKLSANFDIEGFSESLEVAVIIDHEIAAIESITVPAGTFSEAIRVDSIGKINMASIFGENTTPLSSFDFAYSTWYVEGLGMVKTSSEVSGYTTGVSLSDSSLID